MKPSSCAPERCIEEKAGHQHSRRCQPAFKEDIKSQNTKDSNPKIRVLVQAGHPATHVSWPHSLRAQTQTEYRL